MNGVAPDDGVKLKLLNYFVTIGAMQSLAQHDDGVKFNYLYRHVLKVRLGSAIEEQVWTLR